MVLYCGPTASRRMTRAASRRPWAPRVLAVAMAALLSVLVTGPAPAWAASAQFVAEASTATWDGETVRVTFVETGVEPGTTTIAVEASGTVDASCRQDDNVLISTHSSAAVTDVSDYPSDTDATVRGTRELALSVSVPTISGLACTLHVVRSLTVVLRDLDTGATLVLRQA